MPGATKPEAVALRRFDVTGLRQHFMYATDVYRSWVLLAPVTGRFAYTLRPSGPGRAANGERTHSSGECISGELILCPPNTTMDRELLEPSRFWFAEFDLVDPELEPWWPAGKISVSDRRRLRANFRILDDSRELRNARRRHVQTHVLVDVLVLIGWEHQPSARPADSAAVRGAAHLEELVPRRNASIQTVADALSMSPTQFTRRFRKAYGVPPVRYLTELRLARAQRLLLDTDRSVASIADDCGYSSPFYFSRVFRQVTGHTPTSYRESRRV
ncbi:AraC family transcriptional regulator [Kribbella pittospori]|uniref:AraC family transcriptional regulator n=1 Tax=Kribbella pittospori TaxID=722689 RepID=A0A4R0JVE3_9ACTN|nr:AraC family transcriptional regulator [Kribbella pittospori]TCC51473.1 AraC family transcriptional regulator [Kribbella pittospori]